MWSAKAVPQWLRPFGSGDAFVGAKARPPSALTSLYAVSQIFEDGGQ